LPFGRGNAKDYVTDEVGQHSSLFFGEATMPHRRTSGAKVRSHKIGIGSSRFHNGKQSRLQERRMLAEYLKSPDMTSE